MQLNIDSAIVIGFLLLNLVVGLAYGRNVKTIQDYALGGRNFSTIALVSTIVATSITGSGFFVDLSNTYSKGLPYIIASLAWCLQFLIIGVFLVPRMAEFIGDLTVAEMMGKLYGKRVRLITAICGILSNIGIIAVQFKVFGSLVHYFIGVSPSQGIIIAAIIVTLYSAFGGIRAVTYTDMLQFFTFGFVIPMVGLLIWNKFHALNLTIDQAMHSPLFHYQSILNLRGSELFEFIFLFIYFLIPALSSADFQRIAMGRDIKQVKKAFMISLIITLLIALTVMWIPFLIANIDPNVDSNNLIGHIINHYSYSGLKVLIIIGLASMAMSSADSFINNSAILFAHDLNDLFNIKKDKLILSKIFAITSGIFAIYLALSTNDLLDMVRSTAGFYMAIVTVPLIFTILGFRSSADSVLIAMLTSFSVVTTLMIMKVDEVIIPGMITNLIILFGYHYIYNQPGGWIGIKDKNYLEEVKKERRRQINNIIVSIKNSSFIAFCKKTAPKDEMMYTWLGIYCIFFTISTMYSTQSSLKEANGQMILVIYQIMMCTGVITAMYPIWPPRIKHEIIMQIAWNVIIFYMLVFFSCFFVMLSHFGQLQFVIFTINLMLTALLIGWKLSIGMIPIGFYLSVMFYKYYTGLDNIDISVGSPQFIFMYSLILIGSSLIIFLKPNQEQQQLTQDKNEHLISRIYLREKEAQEALAIRGEFIRNVTHEYYTPMTALTSLAETLWSGYDNLPRETIKSSLECIFKSAQILQTFDNNIASLSRLRREGYKLKLTPITLGFILNNRIELCKKLYDENKEDRVWDISIEKGIKINGDKYHLEQLFDNLIINAITYCPKGKITIILKQNKETDQINFSIEDEGIGIPKSELYDIFAEFTVGSRTKTPAGGRGVGLALCKRVIEVHGGSIWAESDGYKGSKFVISLPL